MHVHMPLSESMLTAAAPKTKFAVSACGDEQPLGGKRAEVMQTMCAPEAGVEVWQRGTPKLASGRRFWDPLTMSHFGPPDSSAPEMLMP